MGLTSSSTGNKVLNEELELLKEKCDYTIAIAGNPNVGKSTVFNGLTGMHQHTGNWPGKTVSNASGTCHYKDKEFLLVDIPRHLFSNVSFRRRRNCKRLYLFWKP